MTQTLVLDAGTTNDDAPFERGEIVLFDNLQYIVLANFGEYGKVRLAGPDGVVVTPFYWVAEGEAVRRTGACMDVPACCCGG